MSVATIRKTMLLVLTIICQALVFNRIQLFGCVTPMIYLYFPMRFRGNKPKWTILLLCFALGLGVDIFSNTPGMSAASMTLIGLVQPYLAVIFKPRDSEEEDAPTMKLMGTASFVYYTLVCVFIHNVVYFSLEWFSFFEPLLWLLSVVGSTVLTVVLILIIEHYRKR